MLCVYANVYVSNLKGSKVQACWNSFKDKIRDAVDKFIQISQPRGRKQSSYTRKETINKRVRLFSVYCRTNSLNDLDGYRLVRKQVNTAIRSDKVSETKTKLYHLRK